MSKSQSSGYTYVLLNWQKGRDGPRAIQVDDVPPPDVCKDEVAEASWESFPARDALGWRYLR